MDAQESREKTETGRAAYREAREEILQRIANRDRLLVIYLAAVGAIFGAVLAATTPPFQTLYAIAPLSFGTTMLVAQHSETIARLVAYIRKDLKPALIKQNAYVPLWEDTEVAKIGDGRNVWLRTTGEIAIVVGPLIAVLVANWNKTGAGGRWSVVLWLTTLLIVLLIIGLSIYFSKTRKELLQA